MKTGCLFEGPLFLPNIFLPRLFRAVLQLTLRRSDRGQPTRTMYPQIGTNVCSRNRWNVCWRSYRFGMACLLRLHTVNK